MASSKEPKIGFKAKTVVTPKAAAKLAAKEKAAEIRAAKSELAAQAADVRGSKLDQKEASDVDEMEKWVSAQRFAGVKGTAVPAGGGHPAHLSVIIKDTVGLEVIEQLYARLPSSYTVYEGTCVDCLMTTRYRTACKYTGCKVGKKAAEFFQCSACYMRADTEGKMCKAHKGAM